MTTPAHGPADPPSSCPAERRPCREQRKASQMSPAVRRRTCRRLPGPGPVPAPNGVSGSGHRTSRHVQIHVGVAAALPTRLGRAARATTVRRASRKSTHVPQTSGTWSGPAPNGGSGSGHQDESTRPDPCGVAAALPTQLGAGCPCDQCSAGVPKIVVIAASSSFERVTRASARSTVDDASGQRSRRADR